MKILLVAVNAKYIHSNPALRMLKAYANADKNIDADRVEIEIEEFTINHLFEDVLSGIYVKKPDVVAFSCYIWNWEMISHLIEEIPKVLPDTDIWLGGPEVSYDSDKLMQVYQSVTGIMAGEGEETFRKLCHYYQGDIEISEIKGIYYRCNEAIIYAGPADVIDMSKIPFYYGDLSDLEHKIVYYESSRGCPFACSYCLSSIGERVRFRDTEMVKRELQFFLDNKVPQVKFIDRTFNCNHRHAIAIWRYILEHDNGITNFHFEISADLINEEELAIMQMMRPGLIQLEIGVQSTNDETIGEIRRTMNLEKLKNVVDRIHGMRNIHQHLDLIAGLPHEDMESFIQSFNDVYDMKPDQLQMGFLKVLKGSYMETQVENYGIKYQSHPPYEVLATNWISYADVLVLKKVEEMVEQYYNSGQFKHSLPYIISLFDKPYDFFIKLAEFYDENAYFTNKPARLYKYTVLLEFAAEVKNCDIELVKELLTYDMYLREKCKSRPEFSHDLSKYKKEIYAFEKNKKEHIDVFFYPVWEYDLEVVRTRLANEKLVAFDYDNRDPLDHNAAVRVS